MKSLDPKMLVLEYIIEQKIKNRISGKKKKPVARTTKKGVSTTGGNNNLPPVATTTNKGDDTSGTPVLDTSTKKSSYHPYIADAGAKLVQAIADTAGTGLTLTGAMPALLSNMTLTPQQRAVYGASPLDYGAPASAMLGTTSGMGLSSGVGALTSTLREYNQARKLEEINDKLMSQVETNAQRIQNLGLRPSDAGLAERVVSKTQLPKEVKVK
jgi:hypothetical protein